MRKTISTTFAFLVAALACYAGEPRAVCPVDQHDFGVILEDNGPVSCRMPIVNAGDAPMVILSARANCGCTTPSFPRHPIAPGDTAWIEVTYNPDRRPGRFNKKVQVETNATPRRTVMQIKGTVVGADATVESMYPVIATSECRLRKGNLMLGDVSEIHSASGFIEAYNCSNDTLQPVINGRGRALNVVVEPPIVPPGEQFICSVLVNTSLKGMWGPQQQSFTLVPCPSSAEGYKVDVAFNVKETFGNLTIEQIDKAPKITVDNRTVDLGRISRSNPGNLSRKVAISNRGKEPLKIRRIYCADEGVGIKMKKDVIKSGKTETLVVNIDPQSIPDADFINTEIQIIANDPEYPVTRLRIVGEILP